MYHSFLLRSGITIIVLDNSKYCLMSICFILELRFQVKLFMKLGSQEIFKAWSVTMSLDIGPCWIVWSFERCWERCLSNRFIPWKTDSLSVKVLLQKMTVSFRECIPIMLPTALTINTSYLNLDRYFYQNMKLIFQISLKNAMIYSCWRGVVDRFIMSNMKLTIPPTWKKYPTNLEKPTISAMLPPNYSQPFTQGCFVVSWGQTRTIPHPKHLAAQCQQFVPAEVLFQRVTVSLSGCKSVFSKGFQRELVGKTRKNCASGTSQSSWNCFGSVPVSNGIWGLSIPNCLLDRLGL